MPSTVKRLLAAVNYPRTLPVFLCAMCSKHKRLIQMDVARWNEIDQIPFNFFESINWHMTYKKEFRNLIQHRLKNPSRTFLAMCHYAIARILWKPMESLYIYTEDIGGGLYIQHGFATIITAKKIGENCRIYQQVTIGYKNGTNPPVLEDNVAVTCGAKVLGDITMHSGSLAAAGAVVVKDVPENAIAAGVPARVIGYKDPNYLSFQRVILQQSKPPVNAVNGTQAVSLFTRAKAPHRIQQRSACAICAARGATFLLLIKFEVDYAKKEFGKKEWLVLVLFGLVGQIAWSVENMYFNLFVFETVAPSLTTVTLMVQLSGIAATLTTLVAGTLSDKIGNRRSFISWGYTIWGITVALFGFLSPELTEKLLGCDLDQAVMITLAAVVVGDCVMTLFGSTANDACFNAWVTDNTESTFRGKVEGILSILPLAAMLIVAGGFGIIVEMIGYSMMFLCLGTIISLCGICGIFKLKDNPALQRSGDFGDIFYGFKPGVIKENSPLYLTLCLILIYGIACQIFMPYLIIYMKTFLGFSVVEYSIVFGAAIILGAAVNLYLTRLSDRKNKNTMLYFASAIFAAGLFEMYLAKGESKTVTLITFGIAGFVMIAGYILISALCGSLVRDYTPTGVVGKLQGVRMVFSVLIPMIAGPMIGNGINAHMNIPLPNMESADVMTMQYIPAPEIFLAGAIFSLLMFALIPILVKVSKKNDNTGVTQR